MYHAKASRDEQSVEVFGIFQGIRDQEVGNHCDAIFDRGFETLWGRQVVHID
jgi:hypothetical protein